MSVHTLANSHGMTLTVTSWGASAMRLTMPDGKGRLRDILLGYGAESDYITNPAYMGCVVGRTAGRIWPSLVSIGGRAVCLPVNEGRECHLHGGPTGWHRLNWSEPEGRMKMSNVLLLRYVSPEGESGYPGNVVANVRYEVTEDNRWIVEYSIVTDGDTLISPTQHAYFNLAGHQAGRIDDHVVTLPCEQLIRLGLNKAADGNVDEMAGSTVDFRTPRSLGECLGPTSANPDGIDHCFVVPQALPGMLRRAATAFSPVSGISMNVWTDQPAIHFYTGNYLDGSFPGKAGIRYQRQAGFCLEAQEYPNAVNQGRFPQCLLRPGQHYSRRTEYRFSIQSPDSSD